MATLAQLKEFEFWMPVGKMFKEGTAGNALVSRVPTLAERVRPQGLFDRQFGKRNITVKNVLALPEDIFFAIVPHEGKTYLDSLVRKALISPHGHLLARIFGREEYPVSPQREPEILEATEEALKCTGRDDYEDILREEFIHQGPTPQREVTRTAGMSRSTIQEFEARAFRLIKQKDKGGVLRGHLALPTNSIGRGFVDVELEKDLPMAFKPILLSEEAAQEVSGRDPMFVIPTYNPTEVMRIDLDQFPISRSTRAEIEDQLKRVLATPINSEPVVDITEPVAEPVDNNFFLGMDLTPEQQRRAQTSLQDLWFSRRNANFLRRVIKIETVAELLAKSPNELFSYKGQFGPDAMNGVVEVLAQYLEIGKDNLLSWKEQNDQYLSKAKKTSPKQASEQNVLPPVSAAEVLELTVRFPSFIQTPVSS